MLLTCVCSSLATAELAARAGCPAATQRAATPYRLMLAHLARGAYASPVQGEAAPGAPGPGSLPPHKGPAACPGQGDPATGAPGSPATPACGGAGGVPAFPYSATPAGDHPSKALSPGAFGMPVRQALAGYRLSSGGLRCIQTCTLLGRRCGAYRARAGQPKRSARTIPWNVDSAGPHDMQPDSMARSTPLGCCAGQGAMLTV